MGRGEGECHGGLRWDGASVQAGRLLGKRRRGGTTFLAGLLLRDVAYVIRCTGSTLFIYSRTLGLCQYIIQCWIQLLYTIFKLTDFGLSLTLIKLLFLLKKKKNNKKGRGTRTPESPLIPPMLNGLFSSTC